MSFNKDDIKNSLTVEQIGEVLADLGAVNFNIHQDMIISETLCHNLPGEGSMKLFYYDNTKLFRCYTDCGEYFDVFQLVVKAHMVQYDEEWSLPKAVSYVGRMFGFEEEFEDEFENLKLEDWKIIKRYKDTHSKLDKQNKVIELGIKDDSILKNLPKPRVLGWEQEGIKKEVMDSYGICYYPVDCQVIIPHRDEEGNLIGIRGRSMIQEEAERFGKYRPATIAGTMYNHPLGFALYGLDRTKENIKAIKKAVVFESEKSVLMYESYFGRENNIAVAVCGSSFTIHHFKLLMELGVQEIILAFDRQFQEIGDKEFKRHVKHLQSLADKYKNYVNISCIFDKKMITPYKASPIDCGRDVYLKLFKERIIM